jgi:predicted amidophosphoribosyltransferase
MFSAFLQLLYPKLCFACEDPLFESEEFICTHCRISLPRVDYRSDSPWWLRAKFDGLINYQDVQSFMVFTAGGRVQQLMHQIKYKGEEELGWYLGFWAGQSLKKYHFFGGINCVIPIPLHASRLRKRGYNQAECIARGLAKGLDKPLIAQGLVKISQTDSLIGQDRSQRFSLLKDSFEVNVELEEKHPLIVDDTLTTGATLLAAGEKIKAAGAQGISFFTLAALK